VRKWDLKTMILKMFGDREFYGYEVHKKLASENIKMEISRLYRILNEMMKEGLLAGRWEKSQLGPRKRVYQIGKKGRKALEKILLDAIKTVHMFYGKYLMSLLPKVNVFNNIYEPLTVGLQEKSNIACVTPQYSPMHERFMRYVHKILAQGQIYIIKPSSVQIDLKLDNLTVLAGSYSSIFLRKDFLDLLIIIDLPPKNSLPTALKEWHRVLRQSGKLAIMTPTILLQKYEDPLNIGDFVEKYEHETIEQQERVDKEFLQQLLNGHFNKVEERDIVHMTIISATEPKEFS